MNNFTVVEVNFICIFAGDTKAATIENIMDGIPHFSDDKELVEIAEQVIVKLDTITETEFSENNFKENYVDE